MSKLGKILLYIAVAGAFADVFAGWKSWEKFSDDKSALTQVERDRDAAKQSALQAAQKADDAAKATEAAKTQLTEANNKVDDLTSKLTAAQKTADESSTALTAAKDAAKQAQDNLDHIKSVLGDMTPEAAKDAVTKAKEEVAANASERKILEDQLQAAQNEMADLKAAINKGPAGMPPGISGKVTFVNRAWNFVVLNVGLANGVVPNGELIVYRGRDFLGKIKVTSAESNSAVGDILPNAKADIQVGDDVLN